MQAEHREQCVEPLHFLVVGLLVNAIEEWQLFFVHVPRDGLVCREHTFLYQRLRGRACALHQLNGVPLLVQLHLYLGQIEIY